LYEHERYSLAPGFSGAQMDVLRAIEFHSAERVGIGEITDDFHTAEYAESTIYKALNELQEKGFVEKVLPGVYRYVGP
jgi:predicted transcriptional regulator of viral defense system